MQKDGDLDVESLLQRMERNLSDAVVQTECCDSLLMFLQVYTSDTLPQNLALADTGRIVTILLHATKVHPRYEWLLSNICNIISFLSKHSAPARESILGEGGIDMLVTLINQNKGNIQLQVCALVVVQSVGTDILALPTARLRAVARAVLTVANANHPIRQAEDMEFIADCLQILMPAMHKSLVEDSVRVAVKNMVHHQEDMGAQAAGLSLLVSLVHGGDGDAEFLWNEGAVRAIITAINVVFRTDSDLITNAGFHYKFDDDACKTFCSAIRTLHMNASSPMSEPGLTVLSRMLMKHVRSPDTVQAVLATMAEVLAKVSDNKEVLGRQAVKAVLFAMKKHYEDLAIQLTGLQTLIFLTNESKLNEAALAEADSMQKLIDLAIMHKNDRTFLCGACSLLKIVLDGNNKCLAAEKVLEAGVVKHFSEAISQQTYDAKRLNAASLCCVLFSSVALVYLPNQNGDGSITFCKQFVQDGGAESIILAMTLESKCEHTQWTGSYLICKIFTHCPEYVQVFGLRTIRPIVQGLLLCSPGRFTKEFVWMQVYSITVLNLCMTHSLSFVNSLEFREEFAESGGVGAINKFLQLYMKNIKSNVWLDAIQESCCPNHFIPATVATSCAQFAAIGCRKVQDLCLDNGIIDTLLQILAQNKNNSDIQLHAHAALGSIAHSNEANTQAVMRKGGVELASQAARKADAFMKLFNLDRNQVKGFSRDNANLQLASRQESAIGLTGQSNDAIKTNVAAESHLGIPSRPTASCELTRTACGSQSAGEMTCVACGKSAADVGASRMLKCSACTIAPKYCSAECQSACWPAHKAECRSNKKASKTK
jgi:hypothetical protein